MYKYSDMQTDIFGKIYILAGETELLDISLSEDDWSQISKKYDVAYAPDDGVLVEIKKQLDEYFKGERKTFSFPIKFSGTAFQEKVWNELLQIPYGETRCYADIANAIDNPKAVRAVGQANRKNPIPIVVPCHRVIGKDKSLTGYSGTRTDLKEKLLELEGVF
ncbi:methylated-DNA--[protein]-cysteine S-methyltransferase [Bacillus timonensis]|uniref:Methylated-DNA--protein-cysteine methyltransferase n=1 Tax=Bacillus timonensis TaxID=1033734 RepID=A0A4S3PK56_9BACI|nr:methylated-DNA--[protein]-cysteine S-methyltransferase [Bacillus timonensis]THE09688.1 methylated-DNA--[protein]-cysteine S-methyltransferase [Bacillus timonensis]